MKKIRVECPDCGASFTASVPAEETGDDYAVPDRGIPRSAYYPCPRCQALRDLASAVRPHVNPDESEEEKASFGPLRIIQIALVLYLLYRLYSRLF